jgi:hypothetical protein
LRITWAGSIFLGYDHFSKIIDEISNNFDNFVPSPRVTDEKAMPRRKNKKARAALVWHLYHQSTGLAPMPLKQQHPSPQAMCLGEGCCFCHAGPGRRLSNHNVRAASCQRTELLHRFCFAEKLTIFWWFLAIFGVFLNKKSAASRPFLPRICVAFSPNKKKLQLEPILTKYGSISLSGHLKDA